MSFIFWYLTITLLGLATFPLAFRLLPALPDKGYAFSRTLGWLLWGFFFWLLGTLGVLHNDLGGQIFALLLLLALSWLAWRQIDRRELSEWWSSHHGLVLAVEIVFLVAFVGMALIRAANPDIAYTEKPMEMAFISSILRSPTFPPQDPWLSGYAISYYYFGYVLVAMLARFTATPGPVAFNLGIALVFALSAIGAYGVVYDLLVTFVGRGKRAISYQLSAISKEDTNRSKSTRFLLGSIFGPFFVLLISNLEGFLEILYSRHLFWNNGQSAFWSWLGIADLNKPPEGPVSWLPRLFGSGNWWWWRASRVLQDFTLLNQSKGDVIDEFPVFSFLLADSHPHVLAMPFMFLVVALALNLFLGGAKGLTRLFAFDLPINLQSFALAAVVVGGMAFLNTWDILVAMALFGGAFVLWRALGEGWSWSRLYELVALGIGLGIAILVLYLPFFLSFSSQAGGPLPNLVYVTRGAQFWVMFGSLLIPIFAWLVYEWRSNGSRQDLRRGIFLTIGILVAFWLAMLLLGLLVANVSLFSGINPQAGSAARLYLDTIGAADWGQAFAAAFTRRIEIPGTWLTIAILIAATLGLLLKNQVNPVRKISMDQVEEQLVLQDRPTPVIQETCAIPYFPLFLTFLAAVVVLGPEFVFLRDQFGYRINTIFKFYFEAWLLFGMVAGYAAAVLFMLPHRPWRLVVDFLLIVTIGMGLVYTVYGFADKTHEFQPPNGLTLDGAAFLTRSSPDEWAGIQWLQKATYGNIVEAAPVPPDTGEYSDFGQVSEFSGLPTVIGWVLHEYQWGRTAQQIGSRQTDVQTIYTSRDWTQTQSLLQEYHIRYVFVGPKERATYRVNEAKFQQSLTTVFHQGNVSIYEVP